MFFHSNSLHLSVYFQFETTLTSVKNFNVCNKIKTQKIIRKIALKSYVTKNL